MNKGFITLLSSLLFITHLFGQPVNTTCVDFNQFPAGLLIGPALGLDPGEVILGEEGLNVTIEEILYSNGNTGFGNATINNDGWLGFQGNYIFMGNNSLMLNFSAAGGAVQEVCFDFVDGGGEENFAVNGSAISVVQNFDEILGLTFPSANVTIANLNNPGGILSGTVCVTGVIESLLVGGQEFGVDNVCFGTITDCGILNLNAEIVECNDDGSYDIDVDFDHLSTSPNVAGFDVLINDEIVDFIEAGTELPYTISGLLPTNNSDGTIRITTANGLVETFPYALAAYGPGIPNGGLNGQVVPAYDASSDPTLVCFPIENAGDVAGNIALVERGSCTFESKSINAEEAGATALIICNFEDELITMAGQGELPDPSIPSVMIQESHCALLYQLLQTPGVEAEFLPNEPESFELTICENDNPDCCSTIAIEPDCPDDQPSDCITFDGLLEGSVYGGSVGTPAGTPFFNENGVGMFLLPYQTLFWTTTYGDINILDAAGNPEMTAAAGSYIQFESVNAVFDLTGYSEPIDSITLDFYYTGGGINLAANGAAFLIQNNLQAGFYGLAPGITVQVVFDNNSMTEGQLIITGNVQTLLVGGEGDFRIDNLCINPTAACDITDLIVEASPCNPNNVFSVSLDFDYTGTSDTFKLSVDDEIYGYYAYDDLPLTLSPFVGPTDDMVFEVVDASDSNCYADTVLAGVNCEPCSITLWHDFNAECNPAGGYDQTINLNLVSNLNDLFVVTSLLTGYTDTLGYSDPSPNPDIFPLGLDLINWPIPEQGYDEISVCLLGQPACCATTLFQTPAPQWCDPCPLEEIEFREGPLCFDDGTVGYMEIDVIGAEIGDVLFITIPEAGYSETVVYEGIFNPINFTFPVSGSGTYELIVCGISTNAIDECCLSVPFTLDCGECMLSNLVVEPTPCDDNGQYYLEIDFDYQNTSDSFNLYAFLDYNEIHAYEDLPMQIGPFDVNPYGIVVGATDVGAITGGEYCAVWDTLPPYQCGDLCPLEAINMIDVDCDFSADMVFTCNAFFEVIGAEEGDSLIVTVDGATFFELYNGQLLDVSVPCFPNSSLHTIEVCLITEDGASDCCVSLDFEIDCYQDCPLEGIEFIVPPTCLAPGESYYYTSFEVIGAEEGDILTITSLSSNVVHTEIYNGQLVEVEIPLTDVGMDILEICFLDNNTITTECCISVEFDIACPSCEIYDLVLEPYCDGDSLYYFDIDFVVEGSFADTFVLDMDNGFHAQFLYDELPVTFGPFQSTGENLFVWLYDFDGECGTNTYFQTPDCLDGCVLGAVTSPISSAGCNGDGTYNIPLTIENAQIGDLFYVYSQLTNHADTVTYGLGIANVLQLSNWPTPSQGYDELTICLYDQPDCCVEYGFEVPCLGDCVFEDWVIWLDSCVGSEAYLYVEAFSNTPNTVGYGVTVGNVTIGGLSFNEGHIVGPFPVNGTGFMGVELVHPDCVIYEEISVEGCIDPPCELPLLEVSTECGNASAIVFFEFYDVPFNSWYYVEIPEANISDTLFLGGPTTFPLTIPLPAPDVSLTFDVLICDLFNPDCCEVYTVLVECPPACIIGSDLYNPGAICEQGSDLYSAEILVSGLVEGDSVVITSLETGYTTAYAFVPNGNIGTFYWMDISLLMPIPPNGYDVLEICSADDPNCCTIMEFPVDCFGCGIEQVAWEYECLEDGSFYITIYDLAPYSSLTVNYFFETPGYPGEEFFLSDLPITYGPYNTGPNQDNFIFEVSQADCEPYVEEFVPDCNIAGCLFTNVVIEPHSCDDGYFMMDVEVTVNDPGALGYYVVVDGVFNGPFDYSEPYVTIGPYEGDGTTTYSVLILDIENITCSWFTNVGPVDCNNTGGCDITDLQVTTLDCTPGGTYGIVVDFEVENPGNSFFEVFGPDGEPLGYYPLFIRPVTIQGIEPIEPGMGTVTVCINDNPNCCATQSIIVPDCPSECEILDVLVEFAYCDTSGFYVQLDFAVDNPQSNGYSVVGNGENYGNFSYNQPMPIIGPFSPFTDNIYELVVTDLEDDDCSGFVEFPAFDCNYDCEIGAIVEGTNCTSDSTYFIVLGVDVVNPNSYFVDVHTAAGDFLGFYPITVDGYVLIESVPYTNIGVLELVVCINDDPDCCTSVTVQEPNCGEDCVISDVDVSLAYCENDSFYVQLDFSYVNPVSDGYTVVGNGMNYGVYSYDEPFPVIGPFISNANQVYELAVFDLGDDNCSSFVEFPAFSCVEPECIALEEVNQQVYNLEGGYEDGSLLFETPVANVYMETLDENCNICTVEIGDASDYPDFTDAEGNVLELQPGGIELVFGNTNGYTQQLSFDFGENIDSIMVSVNGSDYIAVYLYDAFTSLPGGISMVIDSYNWPNGTITFTGPIESLGIYTLEEFPIDNICLLEFMDDDNCVEFTAFDHLMYWDTLRLNDYGVPGSVQLVENGVSMEGTSISWGNNNDYFGGIYASTESTLCGLETEGAKLFIDGGIAFDFTPTPQSDIPNSISFDLGLCFNLSSDVIYLEINGESFIGSPFDFPTMIAGVLIEGEQIGISFWNITLTGDLEEFVLGGQYITLDNVCFSTTGQPVIEVWPGDANADNLAHHVDLLNIGIAYGDVGPYRPEDGTSWIGMDALNWDSSFANGVNYKHADCNGDGIIDWSDRMVIEQNYGLSHGPSQEIVSLPFTDLDPPVFVDFNSEIPSGTGFNVPIIAGTEDIPLDDVYGIAFTVEFDPELLPPGDIQIIYPTSWFGEPEVNSMTIDRTYAQEGMIEIAMTRIDHNNVSGYGPVAYIIGVIDDIAGLKADTDIMITKVKAIDKDQKQIPVSTPPTVFSIISKGDDGGLSEEANGIFSVYPNPASRWINVTSRHGFEPEELTLLNANGQVLDVPQENNNRISLESVPSGTYVLRIRSGKTQVHKLIVRQ